MPFAPSAARAASLSLLALAASSHVAACGESSPPASSAQDAAPPDAGRRLCDPAAPFGPLVRLGPSVNDGTTVDFARFSPDEREVYFGRAAAGQPYDVLVARRPSADADFGPATAVAEVNTARTDSCPMLTPDGLTLFLHREAGETHLYSTRRASRTDPFPAPAPIAELNAPGVFDGDPYVVQDGNVLWFASQRRAPGVIYRAARASATAPFGAPVEIGGAIPTTGAFAPVVREDELVLYYTVVDATGGETIFVATRKSANDPFDSPRATPDLNRDKAQYPTWLSADGCTILIAATASTVGANLVVYRATKAP